MKELMEWAFMATEAIDVIDALFQALPRKYQTRGLSPQEKALRIAEHWDELDVAEAIGNLAYNAIEDRIIGSINARGADAMKKLIGRNQTVFGVA